MLSSRIVPREGIFKRVLNIHIISKNFFFLTNQFLDLKMSFFFFFSQEKKHPICSDPGKTGHDPWKLFKNLNYSDPQCLLKRAAGGRASQGNELINAATAFFPPSIWFKFNILPQWKMIYNEKMSWKKLKMETRCHLALPPDGSAIPLRTAFATYCKRNEMRFKITNPAFLVDASPPQTRSSHWAPLYI